MVDLQTQYQFIKSEVDKGIREVLSSAQFINGPTVKNFQSNLESYLGVKHVIPCANGTDALQVAMMGLGLKPGDEVITADFTYASTVEVIALLGLTPVLVDVDIDTFNINPQAIENAITSKTKAIVPVHLFGQPAAMDEILEIAKKYNLYVIEDNAQGIGSNYFSSNNIIQKSGTIGDIGTTSFFPSKNLGCYGDGGAIFTNNDDLAHTIRGIVNHGMYVRYHHDVVGLNSRLDSVQAAILSVKLPLLDFYNERRKEASLLYSKELNQSKNLLIPIAKYNCQSHVFHQYTLRVLSGNRDELSKFLNDNNIPHGIYYPIPLHKQKAYADASYDEENFKISNMMSKQVISLPMHSELDRDQIKFICNKVNEFFKAQEN